MILTKKNKNNIKIENIQKYTLNELKSQKMTTQQEKLASVDMVFTPSQPISVRELFAGRSKEIEKSMEAIVEKGGHLIIYGDRGEGKTYFANILRAIIAKGIEYN